MNLFTQKNLFLSIALAASTAMAAAGVPQSSCRLDPAAALAPYSHAEKASIEEWRDSRLALEAFMSCSPRNIDEASRRLFFDVVANEFQANHSAEIARWRTAYPQAHEGVDVAISIFQTDLRAFMERLADRTDVNGSKTILRYGNARSIASLGPAVKSQVIRMLGNSAEFYGLSSRYSSQEEAMGVLGYWIDPDNHEFGPREKAEFTEILTSLLPEMRTNLSSYQERVFQTALKALAHSDRPEAEAALITWLDAQKDRHSPLALQASKSLAAIQQRRRG